MPTLLALGEFRVALTAAARAHQDRASWIAEELNFPVAAWEATLAGAVGGKVARNAELGVDDPFNPANNTGVPQNTNAQRLAQSPNCQPQQGSPSNAQSDIGGALELGGYPQWNDGNKIVVTSSPPSVWWTLNLDQHGKPVDPCSGSPVHTLQGSITRDPSGKYTAYEALTTGNKLSAASQGSGNDPITAIRNATRLLGVGFP